jgi:hypothetical protein
MRRREEGDPPGAAEARFAALYRDHAREVLAYAVRRGASAEDAADVVAAMRKGNWYGRPLEGDADEGLGCSTFGIRLTG